MIQKSKIFILQADHDLRHRRRRAYAQHRCDVVTRALVARSLARPTAPIVVSIATRARYRRQAVLQSHIAQQYKLFVFL